jgi:fructokinase
VADGRPLTIVAGESLIDRIVRPDGRVDEVPGGGPFNTARALARLGARVAFLGRLSTDRPGRRLRAALDADGVDLSLAVETADPTLLAIARLDERGAATYHFEPARSAAAGLRPADVPTGWRGDAVAIHVGTLGLVLEPTATTLTTWAISAPPGVLVMLDPNLRPDAIPDASAYRRRLATVIARADVVKASVEDLAWLSPAAPPTGAARELLAAGPRAILVTDGPNPVRIVTAGSTVEVPVPDVPVVDTVGAGDAFGAGFLGAWIGAGLGRRDLGDAAALDRAVRRAVDVAAWTVGRAGADPPWAADLGRL